MPLPDHNGQNEQKLKLYSLNPKVNDQAGVFRTQYENDWLFQGWKKIQSCGK